MNGYALQVELLRVIDGDTVVVRAIGDDDGVVRAYRTTRFECPVGTAIKLRIIQPGTAANVRFANFSAPELRQPGGREAKDALQAAFAANKEKLWLFVESPKDTNQNDRVDLPEVLRQRVSFNRIVGRILVGDADTGCRDIVDLLAERDGTHD